MGKKSKGYTPTNIIEKFIMQNGILDVEIGCKCGCVTTRAQCVDKPSFYDDVVYHNYFCPECDRFLRCDGALTPLPVQNDATNVTDESDDETDYNANMRDML